MNRNIIYLAVIILLLGAYAYAPREEKKSIAATETKYYRIGSEQIREYFELGDSNVSDFLAQNPAKALWFCYHRDANGIAYSMTLVNITGDSFICSDQVAKQ